MPKRLKMCKGSNIQTFDELFQEFIKYCKARNLTDATIKYYHTYFHILKKFQEEIRLEDVNEDFIRDYILFLKKTMKPVSINIPLPTSLCALLREYLQYRNGQAEDYLFPTIDNGQLSAQGIKTAIKQYNRKRGVNVTSCHAFRRYFAKQCVLNGVDTFTLQRLGGWKNLDMVRNYVHLY